jgi:hypothetical protein
MTPVMSEYMKDKETAQATKQKKADGHAEMEKKKNAIATGDTVKLPAAVTSDPEVRKRLLQGLTMQSNAEEVCSSNF